MMRKLDTIAIRRTVQPLFSIALPISAGNDEQG